MAAGVKRRGFTIVELLVVLVIISVIGGTASLLTQGGVNENIIIEREAEDAAAWLMSRMSRARTEECSFKLSMSERSLRNIEIRLLWHKGTLSGRTEKYSSLKARIFPVTGNLARTHTYSGEWNTLTPALTFDVKPIPPSNAKKLYIIMSGLGNIAIRDRLN